MIRVMGFAGLVLGGSVACSTTNTIVEVASDSGSSSPVDGGGAPATDGSSLAPDGSSLAPDGSSLAPNWRCLLDPIPSAPAGDVQLGLSFDDTSATPGTPLVGVEVHGCSALDVVCQNPFGSVTTGDGGPALLSVPGGFAGYYEVHAPSFDPALLSRTPQLSSESAVQGLTNVSLLSAGASLAGVTADPSLGVAVVTVADCATTPAAGITIQVGSPGAGERVVYLANDLPASAATQTDTGGAALIFNAPPGSLVVSAGFAGANPPFRTVTTFARKGWVTFIQIRPDQATHTL